MNVIRMTYRDDTVNPNVYLALFFRLVGIYVFERFLGPQKVRREGIKELSGNKISLPVFSSYDAEIIIVETERDLPEYMALTDTLGKCTSVIIMDSELQGQLPNAIFFQKGNEQDLINDLIKSLLKQGGIRPDEADELKNLADIFARNNVDSLTLRAQYFFTAIEQDEAVNLVNEYEKLLAELIDEMEKKQCGWGDRYLMYTQYAALHTLYEMDCFCLRYKLPIAYNRETLIQLCDTLEESFYGFLGDSIKLLKGQILDDLFFEPNKAYERYVNCCRENTSYNSYVYFRKGQYWQNFANDYASALKYYVSAVWIYPEYYRAWFKIGLCCQRLGRYREAIDSYENVRKCLADRISGRCIRPMEMEHIFIAQLQVAYMWEENDNLHNAIEAAKAAERIWNMIDDTSFFELMCGTNSNSQQIYRKRTRECLDVNRIYEKMLQWYAILGERDKVVEYRDKQIKHEKESLYG